MQAAATFDDRHPAAPIVRLVTPKVPKPNRSAVASTGVLAQLWKLLGIEPAAATSWEALVSTRMRIRKGAPLFHTGDAFTSLYVVRAGSYKTVVDNDGHEQVIGYHTVGDVLGVGGIEGARHTCRAVALEDGEVCVLPFDRIEALAREDRTFQHQFYRLLARDVAHSRSALLTLGMARAEQRLASFLLSLSQRYASLGYSSSEFLLRMTREEIGSHLGLTLETVSRLFSRFHERGLIEVKGRTIKIVDRSTLRRLVDRNGEPAAGETQQRRAASIGRAA